ncbi:MAG: hypothetical protein [Caudoviricetes sp.]|nr:MAG: hypothetical protein [Caudoviricetes sp.]
MSLAVIILPTNKTDSIISDRVRKIGQREKGLELEVIVTDANNEGYDLSDKIVTFSENKVGGKIVSDSSKDHIQILNAKDGRFKYKLAEAVYAASGEAWFDISSKDGEVVDTTKSFDIEVIENAEIHINNDNYVSTLIDLETYYKAIIQRTDQQTTEMVNKYNGEVGQLLDGWKTQSEQINQDYEKQKEGLASDAQAEIAKIEKDKQAAIDAVNQSFKDKLNSIQTDYDNWKQTTATDFEERIDKVSKELATAEKNQADMKETIDSAMAAVDRIKGVDFTKYALKEDLDKFYDKTTIDEKLKNAGTLKQISVNGGTPISPDDKGVANIDIDSIDLSNYETKEDANSSHNDLKAEINKRPLTVNNISPDDKGNIAIAIPDVSKMQQDITTLQNEMEEQKSKVTYHYADTLADGQKYSAANPQILTGTP